MDKFILRRSKKSGKPPGTLLHIGKVKTEHVRVSYMDYDVGHASESIVKDVSECFMFRDTSTVSWINVSGLTDSAIIEKIGNHFNVHPLIQEDIVNTEQRPKFEDLGDYIYIVLKMIYLDNDRGEIESEQISVIVAKNFVISFQEGGRDVFDGIRERIRKGVGRIRSLGNDYLAYVLIDAIVDNYFSILESFGEIIEDLEIEVIDNPDQTTSRKIHSAKSELIYLRKAIWPMREVISTIEHCENKIMKKTTQIYIRDVYDHVIQAIDNVETLRDLLSGLMDVYLSSISNKMNEVMKVLTIFSTIFIPLTFIVGLYGMNFHYMPELDWRYGYFVVWGILILVTVWMMIYFKRKKWI